MPSRKSIVIVESPAKARTIASYLGPGYVVESSVGHIRDLPKSASSVPAAHKKKPWARLGVDVENGFRPLYVVDPAKKGLITRLKGLLRDADELFLATDEDREGESIAWHLLEVLQPKVPVRRMVFHEITRRAIEQAIKHPREVDRRLVDAQEARRILDRLYGYEVSPVLWKKVMPRLSAGRVQSVATRIVVERERERMRFRTASYWDLEAIFGRLGETGASLDASLVSLGGVRVATGKDFGEDGHLLRPQLLVLDEARAQTLARELAGCEGHVSSVERKPQRRSPSPPFMTSTLQQEAGRKLKFSSSRTMRAAQTLYESGYITYMRTDSTTLSGAAIRSAREQIQSMYGEAYLPERPRVYRKKVKNAQEAHEAIRPAGEVFRLPEHVVSEVGRDEARLYELIWKRTIASQMSDARIESVQVRVLAVAQGGGEAEFSASGNTIVFPGFLRAYVEGSDDPAAELENRERHLPAVAEGETLEGRSFEPLAHQTQPSARFTEASLVRKLEELGVGRPSTYASIITTILDRGYVWRKGTALIPSFTAFAVVALLEQHFTDLVDYAFTARMEDELDAIAQGTERLEPWLSRFYFGVPDSPEPSSGVGQGMGLRALVADRLSAIDARAINSLVIGADTDGQSIVIRVGRYGAYLQCGERTGRIPEDMPPDELTVAKATELLATTQSDRELGADPETGLSVFLKVGRFGSYVQLGESGSSKGKPKTCSLLREFSPEDVTLQDALRLLSLPRTVGIDPADQRPITAQIGRYGPYLAKGTDSRSLETEQQVFSVTLDEALALFAQPRRRQRSSSAEPLAELGPDAVSGKLITLRQGRFGLYVTDGETNASLRKGDSPEDLTAERAQELLQTRRERGPVQRKRGGSRASAKKTPSQKASKKSKPKTTSRAAGKKTAKKPAKKSSTKVLGKPGKSSSGSTKRKTPGADTARGGTEDAPTF